MITYGIMMYDIWIYMIFIYIYILYIFTCKHRPHLRRGVPLSQWVRYIIDPMPSECIVAWCPLSCVTPSWLDSHDWWEWLLSWKKRGLKGLDCRTLVGQAFRLEIQNLIKREASWRRSIHDMWKDDLAMFVCLAVEMNRAWTSTSEQHCVKFVKEGL